MKNYLILLLLIITTLTGCTTQSQNTISDNQEIVSNVRSIYLKNAINSIDNDIFNKITFEDIMFKDIDQLILVQNEVPFLKNNLLEFNKSIHNSFRNATVKYQDILNKYSQKLEFPLSYPSENNYYFIEEPGIDVLFDNYGELINAEINTVMDEIFEKPITEYKELSTNYNIYCESLDALDRQSLSQINTDIGDKVKQLFLNNIYYSILTSEKSYFYEKYSFEPYKIIITK